MSTIPDLSQVQAVSFDDMAFKIGLFQFSDAVAWVFNVYKYNEVTNAHTVVCFVAGKHAGRDALLARIVVDGGLGPVLGFIDVDKIPDAAFNFMQGSLYNVVCDKTTTFELHLQYDGVVKVRYIGSLYCCMLVTRGEFESM